MSAGLMLFSMFAGVLAGAAAVALSAPIWVALAAYPVVGAFALVGLAFWTAGMRGAASGPALSVDVNSAASSN